MWSTGIETTILEIAAKYILNYSEKFKLVTYFGILRTNEDDVVEEDLIRLSVSHLIKGIG